MQWWHKIGVGFTNRTLVGSDLIIVTVIFVHLFEAVTFVVTTDADDTVGMAAILAVFGYRWLAVAVMIVVSIFTMRGQFFPGLRPIIRFFHLVPQLSMLLITSTGAVYCAFGSDCPDGLTRPTLYVLCNQAWRILMPLCYVAAIYARVKPEKK